MNKFFTKTSALLLVCLNASLIFGAATAQISLAEVLDDVRSAPAATLPFSQCMLNFNDGQQIAVSAGTLVVGLIAANADGTLSPEHLAYFIFEGLTAEARKNPASLGPLGTFLSAKTANDLTSGTSSVYTAFQKITGQITTGSNDLSSIFASQAACTAFVTTTVNTELPQLLKALGLATTPLAADISVLSGVFVPIISPLIYGGYNGLTALVKKASAEVQVIDAKIKACCGCWPF